MITADKARELNGAYIASPSGSTWLALTSVAQELAVTVIAQAEQINNTRALICELRGRYAILDHDAAGLLAALGDHEP